MNKYKQLFNEGNKEQLEKLKQNEHKSGWDDIDIKYAFERLSHERDELLLKIKNYNIGTIHQTKIGLNEIKEEAADIANFAHMIIYKCNRLIEKEQS